MTKKIFIISVITLVLDQFFKLLIDFFLNVNEGIIIIDNFFKIYYIHNYGAAWGIMQNQTILLILISILALGLVYRYMNTFKDNVRNMIAFGLIYGGITGNLLDRLFLGHVRDFISFRIFNYNFPVFNIGDMAIFFGVVLLILAIIKGEDNENRSPRKSKKN